MTKQERLTPFKTRVMGKRREQKKSILKHQSAQTRTNFFFQYINIMYKHQQQTIFFFYALATTLSEPFD
jgi:hypothetical protein